MTRIGFPLTPLLLAIAIGLASSPTPAGPAGGSPGPERFVDVGTHELYAYVQGEGSPTVVIDSGIGSQSEEWRALQEQLAEVTRVVTYDRAGYGRSEPGPLPRDSAREADELKALLHAGAVEGPYVLVGHSLGALNVQVFADRYPNDIVGLVLLDPPPLSWMLGEAFPDLLELAEKMTAQWQEVADKGLSCSDPDERRQAAFFSMIASEHREMTGRSALQAAAIESFGDIPLVAIAAGVPNPLFGEEAEEYQQYWVEQTRERSSKSSRGRFVLAEQSGHQIHQDEPGLVVSTIIEIVERAVASREQGIHRGQVTGARPAARPQRTS